MRLGLVSLALISLFGCGSNSVPGIEGSWVMSGSGQEFLVYLTQSGSSVTGLIKSGSDTLFAPTVTGTYTFPQVHLTLTWAVGDSTSSYTGVAQEIAGNPVGGGGEIANAIVGTLSGFGALNFSREPI